MKHPASVRIPYAQLLRVFTAPAKAHAMEEIRALSKMDHPPTTSIAHAARRSATPSMVSFVTWQINSATRHPIPAGSRHAHTPMARLPTHLHVCAGPTSAALRPPQDCTVTRRRYRYRPIPFHRDFVAAQKERKKSTMQCRPTSATIALPVATTTRLLKACANFVRLDFSPRKKG